MYERILVPTDGSAEGTAAFDHAVDLAAAVGAAVTVLYVADTNSDSVTLVGGEVVDALEQEGERIVAESVERASDSGVAVTTAVEQGDPPATILDYADREGCDLIVIGARGSRGVRDYLLGSTTERVVRGTTTPVLTITPEEE
ncbi:universal stress protein [Halorarius litoreus]|uniref:universal stress protein n=1 Tax=Halorarius litoreus TaxID=2962676 RepID=UPI0020CF56B3|nr:universal stress protein [Halorarius litoreus]